MKDAVAGERAATAALANAQIHALSANVHYAGKYYYEGKEKYGTGEPRMNDFARHMNSSRVFKRQRSIRSFAIVKSAVFFWGITARSVVFNRMRKSTPYHF